MNKERKYNLMFDIARRYAQEGTCTRMKGGAVIFTPDFHVVTSGYNGAPKGLPQCDEVGCLMLDNHCVRACHAETNAIIQAARVGLSISGLYIASTNFPCPWCIRMILQASLTRVYYLELAPTYDVAHRDIVVESCEHARVVLHKWEERKDVA